ncbi:hypothetical protein D0C36_16240 [Mucilaginibacter conchicola]|uniref:Uncharacterized protein n=2 Tax=Mucilaginibacter conchicola TaxID=2303333 RepID=A0A372NWD0_9SPHI|nr:hypothetical protein D0C36_16240 [Mucilaginibacter conchicola]
MRMATTSVLGTVFETLLCSPGMNEAVKIDVKMSRKTVLFLNSIIELSLTTEGEKPELIKLVPAEDVEKLKDFAGDCLDKAGLKELSEKMKGLSGK